MHFYDQNGVSAHTVIAKNGKERPTTLADCRKLRLYPSVSTVKDVGVGYGLLGWMHGLLLDTALSNPPSSLGYAGDKWKKEVLKKYSMQKNKAANRGTEIHGKLDVYYKTGEICKEDKKFITPAIELIADTFPNRKFNSETSFTHKGEGFGGCVDLYAEEGIPLIIDFKTKDKNNIAEMKQYDDHKIQLAAYQGGLQLPEYTRRFNLFISVNEDTPGECHLIECLQFDKYWEMFLAYLNLWKVKNNYDPTKEIGGIS